MFRKAKVHKENVVQDRVASKIASSFIKIQVLFTKVMNKIFSDMDVKKMKLFLLTFCVFSGGFSIYLVVNALVSKPVPAIRIDTVSVPKHIDKAGDELMENFKPEEIYRQIKEYKQYMDSLGLPIAKSLLDSMKVLEGIYEEQQR